MHTTRTRITVTVLAVFAATAALFTGTAAGHGEATCSGIGALENHGQHVVGDYVTGTGGISGVLEWPPAGQVGATVGASGGAAQAGGPARFGHFAVPGLAPGASFCNPQAHPNGFTTPAPFGG